MMEKSIDDAFSEINNHVSVNVELKIRVTDREAAQKQLVELFGSLGAPYLEEDYLYAAAMGNLMLRVIDKASSGILIAYERTPSSDTEQHVPMITEYRWSEVPDVESMRAVLDNSLDSVGVVRKRRSVLASGKYLVRMDELDEIGTYVEIIYRLAHGEAVREGLLVLDDLMRTMKLDPTLISGLTYHDLFEVRRAEEEKRADEERLRDQMFDFD